MMRITKTKLYEEVIVGIEEMMRANHLQTGDRLQSEKELALYFGVSKTAVREALSALQTAGLIEVRQGSGIYVRSINEKLTNPLMMKLLMSRDNMLQILEVRKGMETEGVFLAAQRADATDIHRLQECLVGMAEKIEKGENAANGDFNFHCALIQAAHNPVYSNVFNTIVNVFHEGVYSSHEYFSLCDGPRRGVLEEHQRIFDAVNRQRPEEARELMRIHLENVEINLRRLPS